MNYVSVTSLLFTICLVLTSCKSIGPRQITLDRYRYNEVLQNTRKEELLTNIVRARYMEPFFFLKPTSISASYTFSPSVSSSNSATITRGSITPYSVGLSPSLSFSDSPSITYTPVSTSEFLGEIYRPVSLESLHMLMYGGATNARLLLKLAVQYVISSDIDNGSEAAKDEPETLPVYKRYYEFLRSLHQLYLIGGVKLIPWTFSGSPTIVIDFVHGYDSHPLAIKIKKILKLPTSLDKIFLSTKPNKGDKSILQIEMRSIKGMMNYLSHGVRVPPEDIRDHMVNSLYGPHGEVFNFSPLVADLITVYYCDIEPSNVFAKTYIHNHWFYIKETDSTSKTTLNFLSVVLLLTGKQLGNDNSDQGPVLTLPVIR